MDTLSNPNEQEVAFEKLVKLRWHRLKSDESEEQIATQRLGFESAEHMYRRLKDWGWPDWAVYKERPKPKRKARRSRQGEGEVNELPPDRGAAELIQEAIKKHEKNVKNLWRRREYLKSKRFTVDWTISSTTVYERDRGWAQLWEEICAVVGKDPATTDKVKIPSSFDTAVGASRTPLPPLPQLIAVYALANEPLKPLVDELHPNPEDVSEAKLEEVLGKLKLSAEQLARLVRGSEVKQGSPTEGLSPDTLWAARHIPKWRGEGMSEDNILELLRECGRESGSSDLAGLTKEDVSRLGNLHPPTPPKKLRFP